MTRSADFTDFNLNDWVDYTQRQHWRTMDMTLERISEVWKRMAGATSGLVITVGGTNGKGSTISMLNAAYSSAGLKTGAYTSPHLVRYNERIKIAGVDATDEDICQTFCKIEYAREDIPLTYFEFGTLCALLLFQQHRVDVSLLEVGMGGRLDAINMIDPDIAIITSIGIDHEQWLGNDRSSIAFEKAGIMRPHTPVVCTEPNPPKTIQQQADEKQAILLQFNTAFSFQKSADYYRWTMKPSADHWTIPSEWLEQTLTKLPFKGDHQHRNLSAVCAVLSLTADRLRLDKQITLKGISNASIMARCQILQQSPLIILDVAHNADSAKELSEFLESHSVKGQTYSVFGVLEDKTLDPILCNIADHVDSWLLAGLEGDRGQSAQQLLEKMQSVNKSDSMACYSSPRAAYDAALLRANDDDRIIIFGSFHTVGDIIQHLNSDFS